MMNCNRVLLTALSATIVSAPALAQDRNGDGPPTARIVYADLDLTTPAGKAAWHRRLVSATRQMCDVSGERDLQSLAASARCRQTALKDGETQTAALFSKSQRLALLAGPDTPKH